MRREVEFNKLLSLLSKQKALTDEMLKLTLEIQTTFNQFELKTTEDLLKVIPEYRSVELMSKESCKENIRQAKLSYEELEEFFDRTIFSSGGFFGYVKTGENEFVFHYYEFDHLQLNYFY